METTHDIVRVLTIAGSDSGGGAGIQADLKTFFDLGCYGMSAITSVTAQNTLGVQSIYPVSLDVIRDQMDAVFTDIGCDAVKIGMLYSDKVVDLVAERLKKYQAKNIVLDPVVVATSGDLLIEKEAVEAIKSELFPIASIVTPNLPEAETLLNSKLSSRESIESAGEKLMELGSQSLVIKGGHSETDASDFFISKVHSQWLAQDRIQTNNTHGTGCTFSSAIASKLALGLDLEQSVKESKQYLTDLLSRSAKFTLGKGAGPVHIV